ncbi:hypothetical protein F5888DRAFT_1708428 [Russula emetica]|nr:hypothetical protein F5888DRAFT_1708428 [Russula emetica]
MVSIPSASASATSLITPRTERFSRSKVSGIDIPQTLRSGDFGIARPGGVAVLNIQLSSPSDLQATVQRRVLDVLAQQIMLGRFASSTSMELRRLGLETLHQILQASGHTLLVGWETIFEALGSVCRPALSDPARHRPTP